ncbi:MAG TPA: site-specific integrase [Aestuariivirga sp.]|nr:site-specific integrase [Aestuariivirga sp.]
MRVTHSIKIVRTDMKGRPAKVLGVTAMRQAMSIAGRQKLGLRNKAIILLSFKAGLRAGEIAALRWEMLLDATGRVGRFIELPARVAKKGSGRRIPISPELLAVLGQLLRERHTHEGPVIRSSRGRHMTAKAVVNWFTALYRNAGLEGCSSHSGRRTFVTRAARLITRAGGSLRDVQQLAGHRSIQTTQGYIEGDAQAQHRLVRMI